MGLVKCVYVVVVFQTLLLHLLKLQSMARKMFWISVKIFIIYWKVKVLTLIFVKFEKQSDSGEA